LRIIAGGLRGRWIKTIKEPTLRPISGRIKKSLFDIIAGLVPGSRLLDLFAGTGAVGLEALSRGAKFAFFVDVNRPCVELLEKNLAVTGFSAKARVQRGNALSDLSWIPFRAGVDCFDLIFLGPPYKDEHKRPLAYSNVVLERIIEARLLASGGLIVGQHHVKEKVLAPKGLRMARREKYGDTFLSFFREEPAKEGVEDSSRSS
jgi:16S rRNA (guanine(966)-N(2))-methyltransferase RsmD